MVVSYASSPVAEVVFADPRPAEPPTGVLLDGCFRQVEFAGVLAGTDAPAEARAFIDFLLSPAVQSDIPLNMFVSRRRLASAEIPADYAAFAADPGAPLSLDPARHRRRTASAWIEEWTQHRPALSRRAALLLAIPPGLFLAIFFAWPVATIVARGLLPAGGFDRGGGAWRSGPARPRSTCSRSRSRSRWAPPG